MLDCRLDNNRLAPFQSEEQMLGTDIWLPLSLTQSKEDGLSDGLQDFVKPTFDDMSWYMVLLIA